jgi:uncharacterized membrane protein
MEAGGVVLFALGALIAISRFLVSQIRSNNHQHKLKTRTRKSDLNGLEV